MLFISLSGIPTQNSSRYEINNHTNSLRPEFVTGLTEAEGSFSITKHKDNRAKFGMSIGLRFKITMLSNGTDLLLKVQSYFGFGTISLNKNGSVDFLVKDLSNLLKIKEHFIKYPLRGTKYLDFLDFLSVMDMFEKKINRREVIFKSILNISEGMNSYRKDFSGLPLKHTLKNNSKYIPINGHYVSGFIAGDGCLYLRTKSNFGSMGIQISQHLNNYILIREIADYFKLGLKVSPHGKASIQITIGGKKLWKDVIYSHFLTYPLHGTKEVHFAKLQKIALYLDSGVHLIREGRALVFNPEAKKYILDI